MIKKLVPLVVAIVFTVMSLFSAVCDFFIHPSKKRAE
ncbi:UNVERIFIED_CONTAM: hypothetical protein Cloal_2782 [Acetivibrio alkalicellulosi]